MTTLTATYCKFCDVVAGYYATLRNAMTPKLDKKAFKELSALSDRELNDIGIARSEIRSIAMGTYKPYKR